MAKFSHSFFFLGAFLLSPVFASVLSVWVCVGTRFSSLLTVSPQRKSKKKTLRKQTFPRGLGTFVIALLSIGFENEVCMRVAVTNCDLAVLGGVRMSREKKAADVVIVL